MKIIKLMKRLKKAQEDFDSNMIKVYQEMGFSPEDYYLNLKQQMVRKMESSQKKETNGNK